MTTKRSPAAPTLPIRNSDRGRRTTSLDLALAFDVATRTYHPVASR